jgi:hypothetical protein
VLNDPGLPSSTAQVTGPGHIYIRDGIYKMGRSFRGFNIKSSTMITLGPQALIRVPDLADGYSGYVFGLEPIPGSTVSNCTIDGGVIEEVGNEGVPPKRKWTAIMLKGNHSGVLFNKFMNTVIINADTGIRLEAHNTRRGKKGGWVNGNSFQFLKMWHHRTFVDFAMFGPYTGDVSGINRNHFMNLECQSINGHRGDPDIFTTAYGVKNIKHVGNTFIDVNIWDFPDFYPTQPQIPTDAKIANVTNDATSTIIIGGTMTRTDFSNTNRNFEDKGSATKIIR